MVDRRRVLSIGIRIAYAVVWLLLLIYVESSYDSTETSDSEKLRSILFTFVTFLALPSSLVILGLMAALGMLVPLLDASTLDAFGRSVLVSKEWFRLQFFLWWSLMFAVSYWQWFRLVPKFLSKLQRWLGRSHDRVSPPGTPQI